MMFPMMSFTNQSRWLLLCMFCELPLLVSGCIFSSRISHEGSLPSATSVQDDNKLRKLISRLDEYQQRHHTTLSGIEYISRDIHGSITGLSLYGDDVNDENIRLISAIPTLERLELCCVNTPLTAQSFSSLAHTKLLKELILLDPAPELTKEMGSAIANLENLAKLEIGHCSIQKGAFEYLYRLKKLHALCLFLCDDLTEDDFGSLARCRCLAVLQLVDTHITDKYLDHAREFPSLRQIILHDTDVSQNAVQRLQSSSEIDVKYK